MSVMTREHSSICEYWLDQYWNECSCGLNKEMSQREYFEMRLGQSGLRPNHLNSERLPHGK